MTQRPVVMDSWAMMAFFENESAAEKVEHIILEAHQSRSPLLMSVVNAGELWYSTARGHSVAEANKIIIELENLKIEVVDADWEITKQAATFKMRGKIAYADCFAAALTKIKSGDLVTGDSEFKQVEEDISIVWLDKKIKEDS